MLLGGFYDRVSVLTTANPRMSAGCVSCSIQTERGQHHSVSATSALHQEIAVPFVRHGEREVDPKLFAANSECGD